MYEHPVYIYSTVFFAMSSPPLLDIRVSLLETLLQQIISFPSHSGRCKLSNPPPHPHTKLMQRDLEQCHVVWVPCPLKLLYNSKWPSVRLKRFLGSYPDKCLKFLVKIPLTNRQAFVLKIILFVCLSVIASLLMDVPVLVFYLSNSQFIWTKGLWLVRLGLYTAPAGKKH